MIKLKCKRCWHEWVQRVDVVTVCARCKTPYWNRDKKVVNKKKGVK